MRKTVILGGFVLAALAPSAGIGAQKPPGRLLLAGHGWTDYRIVLATGAPRADVLAANLLRSSVEAICGAVLPIVRETESPADEEIVLGRGRRFAETPGAPPVEGLGEDGYHYRAVGRRLFIAGGSEKGAYYGIAAFLESELGCRMYAKDVLVRPRRDKIDIPASLDVRSLPAFAYREVYMPDALDDDYADWHGIDNRRVREREWGLYVHTFRALVPPETYFKDHPEYFSELAGQRVPDAQLCLSNPDVFRLVVQGLRERMKESPEAKYWSVSQNDTFGACQCPACRATDAKYGGPSGTLLAFINRVAREFPDKVISTLAYQYTRPAPVGVVPEKNVNIMLCTIECNRSRPIAGPGGDASFVKDMRDWARLTPNLYLWDYVVQFRNYVDPFPNLRVLQPNLRYFKASGVPMVFEQGSGASRSEFHELRTYLLAKLLWNPDADVAALTEDFLKGYYGLAADEIGAYIKLLHDSLDASGGDLGIYGFPWDGIKTYLTPGLIAKYEKLFDDAEDDVYGAPTLEARVRFARLPVSFAALEVAKRNVAPGLSMFRTGPADGPPLAEPSMIRRLDAFVAGAKAAGVLAIDERGTTPDAYRAEIESFLAEGMVAHLGYGKPVRLESEPSPKYPVGGAAALTDGLRGTTDYHCNWLGFEGKEMEAVVDLGRPTPVRAISLRFLQDIDSWIWLPEAVEYSVSTDGRAFEPVKLVFPRTGPKDRGAIIEDYRGEIEPRAVRFVKARTKSVLSCPAWHKGAGGKAWLFADEFVIE